MRPDILHGEFLKILESSFVKKEIEDPDKEIFTFSESEMFRLWNILGEELGIDLSLANEDQRRMLFEACENGKKLTPKDFGSLLWLVYYGDSIYQ